MPSRSRSGVRSDGGPAAPGAITRALGREIGWGPCGPGADGAITRALGREISSAFALAVVAHLTGGAVRVDEALLALVRG